MLHRSVPCALCLVELAVAGCAPDHGETSTANPETTAALAALVPASPPLTNNVPPSTPGRIGDLCASSTSCGYERATCVRTATGTGVCSLPCSSTCPTPKDKGDRVAVCVEHPENDEQGICLARCDWQRFPESGCSVGSGCRMTSSFVDVDSQESVCVPLSADDSSTCMGDEVLQPNVGLVEPSGLGGCPAGMARIAGTRVCIDRWEAHLVEVLTDGTTVPWSPYFNPGQHPVKARSAPGAVPQGYISGLQAAQACLAAGKRLCSRWQWTRACRGTEERLYPYGNTRVAGVCNDHREGHPLVDYFASKSSWIWKEMGHSCLNQLPSSLVRTGASERCVTPEGVHDMVGNLHEWVDDPKGTFLGGFFVDATENGEGCRYATIAHGPKHWDYSTGFRCCAYRDE